MQDVKKAESFLDEFQSNEKTDDELFEESDTEETPAEETTAADSPSESEEEDNPSQEGEKSGEEKPDNTPADDDVPFHKHPRFQEIIKQRDDEKKAREKLEERLSTLESKSSQEEDAEPEIPAWFAETFGNDERAQDAWKKYQSYEQTQRQKIKQEIIEDQKKEVQQQEEEQRKWDEWVDTEIQTLRDSGKEFDKNELLDVALKFKPEDDDGNISLPKALEILELQKGTQKKENTDAKKKVASKTGSDNRGSETEPQGPKPEDVRRMDMRTLISKFSK